MKTRSNSNANALNEFADCIKEQITALKESCREFLDRQCQTDKNCPREIKIEIGSSLDNPDSPTPRFVTLNDSSDCWTNTYHCGKTTSGYIYCSQTICMYAGPVTVAP